MAIMAQQTMQMPEGMSSSSDSFGAIKSKVSHSKRIYYCQRCLNHGLRSPRRRHKARCPFTSCPCGKCMLVIQRRELNTKLSWLAQADTQQQQIVVVGAGVPSQTAIEERQEINVDYERVPNCQKCGQHGLRARLKGHKRDCPYRDCQCPKCFVIGERQKLMATQIKIRRRQRKELQPMQGNGKDLRRVEAERSSFNEALEGVQESMKRARFSTSSPQSQPHSPQNALTPLQAQMQMILDAAATSTKHNNALAELQMQLQCPPASSDTLVATMPLLLASTLPCPSFLQQPNCGIQTVTSPIMDMPASVGPLDMALAAQEFRDVLVQLLIANLSARY